MKIDEIEELLERATEGNVRINLHADNGKLKHAIVIGETKYVLENLSDNCIGDLRLISMVKAIAEQYVRARRFDVTEEFVKKVNKQYLNYHFEDVIHSTSLTYIKAALDVLWEEIENENTLLALP